MKHYAGLDVSVKETSVCVIDEAGKTIREVKVASEPEAIVAVLVDDAFTIERIGLEAGPLSQWLYSGLAETGLPVSCIETRHMKAALSAQLNKSDRNDARGIAQMMRVGLYRPVHVKTLASQKRRMLLTSRQLLQAKALDIENDLRGTLRNFGLKVGVVGTTKFEARACRGLSRPGCDHRAPADRPQGVARAAWRSASSTACSRAPRQGLPPPHDSTRRRPSGRANLPCDGRRSWPLQELQGSRCRVRLDAAPPPVG